MARPKIFEDIKTLFESLTSTNDRTLSNEEKVDGLINGDVPIVFADEANSALYADEALRADFADNSEYAEKLGNIAAENYVTKFKGIGSNAVAVPVNESGVQDIFLIGEFGLYTNGTSALNVPVQNVIFNIFALPQSGNVMTLHLYEVSGANAKPGRLHHITLTNRTPPASGWTTLDIGDTENLLTTSKELSGAINELFTYAGDGKTEIASAITGKGVPASPSDSFGVLADKIDSINDNKVLELYAENTYVYAFGSDYEYKVPRSLRALGNVYFELSDEHDYIQIVGYSDSTGALTFSYYQKWDRSWSSVYGVGLAEFKGKVYCFLEWEEGDNYDYGWGTVSELVGEGGLTQVATTGNIQIDNTTPNVSGYIVPGESKLWYIVRFGPVNPESTSTQLRVLSTTDGVNWTVSASMPSNVIEAAYEREGRFTWTVSESVISISRNGGVSFSKVTNATVAGILTGYSNRVLEGQFLTVFKGTACYKINMDTFAVTTVYLDSDRPPGTLIFRDDGSSFILLTNTYGSYDSLMISYSEGIPGTSDAKISGVITVPNKASNEYFTSAYNPVFPNIISGNSFVITAIQYDVERTSYNAKAVYRIGPISI